MKILHTGDLHLGKNVNGYSMLSEQEYVLSYIEEYILKNDIDTICISGDVYDKAIASIESISVFDKFILNIVQMRKKIIIISGNHDQSQRLSQYSPLLTREGVYISKPFCGEVEKVVLEEVNFYLLPYTTLFMFKQVMEKDYPNTEEAIKDILSKIVLDEDKCNILVAHDYITYKLEELVKSDSERDLIVGGSSFIDATIFKAFDYVALGHLHKAQKVGFENIRYSGSILKYSFSERNHQKSVTIFDTELKTIQLQKLPFLHDLVVIKGNLEELLSKDFYTKLNFEQDYFKAIITDKTEVIDAHLRLLRVYPNLMEIEKEAFTNKIEGKIINKSLKIEEALEDFFTTIYSYEMTKEDNEIIMKSLNELRRRPYED